MLVETVSPFKPMQIYWMLKDVPELAPLSPKERSVVHWSCYTRHGLVAWQSKVALLASGLCASAGVGVSHLVRLWLELQPSLWQVGIGGAIGGGLGSFIFSQVVTRQLRPFYAEYVRTELQSGVGLSA